MDSVLKLTLIRTDMNADKTFGLLDIDGGFFCHTLEDADRKLESGGEKVYGKTAIPRGTYQVVVDYSNRFKRLMPRLVAVPGFTGIRIHTGNTAADTDGCILVGDRRDENGIAPGSTWPAYNRLMERLEDAFDRGAAIEIEVM